MDFARLKLPMYLDAIQLCSKESSKSGDTLGYLQRPQKIHRTCFTAARSKKQSKKRLSLTFGGGLVKTLHMERHRKRKWS